MHAQSSGIFPRPPGRPRVPLAFDHLVGSSGDVRGVMREEFGPDDRLVVYTRNSVYELRRVDDTRFEVSGGWFERMAGRPAVLTVTGCTWGGSAVRRDLLAGCGMRMEFGNRVLTSVIRRVVLYPGGMLN